MLVDDFIISSVIKQFKNNIKNIDLFATEWASKMQNAAADVHQVVNVRYILLLISGACK